MNVSFCECKNLDKAAGITFDNMQVYYKKFAPEWNKEKVSSVTAFLDNYDILYDKKVVGVMRLEVCENEHYLRDLQVLDGFKNLGIGKLAIDEAKRLTKLAKGHCLKLRVLKISPAINLYKRNGFDIESEDNRFFNMAIDVI